MTDEAGQVYPFTVDALLDKAIGPEGYYGVFTVNHAHRPGQFGRLGCDRRLRAGTQRPDRLGQADAQLDRRPQRFGIPIVLVELRTH